VENKSQEKTYMTVVTGTEYVEPEDVTGALGVVAVVGAT
jgi:hypothetical protein